MFETASKHRQTLRHGIIFLLYGVTAGVVLAVFVFRPGINWYERAKFVDMVHGNAYRPYAYRMLVPETVRLISEATPEWIKHSINSSGEQKRIIQMLGWEPAFLHEYAIALAIMFSCFVSFAYVLRRLIQRFYTFPLFVADFMPIIGLVILPLFFQYYSHIYDPATLLLFSLALACISSGRLLWFYFVFILAVFNKETSILLIGLFFAREYEMMRSGQLTGHLILLSALWATGKTLITYSLRGNPGSFVEWHWDRTVNILYNPSFLLVHFLLVIIILGVLVRYGWRLKPLFLRRGLLITLTPLIVLATIFGSVEEMREYYEAYPFAFLLIVPTIADLFKPIRVNSAG